MQRQSNMSIRQLTQLLKTLNQTQSKIVSQKKLFEEKYQTEILELKNLPERKASERKQFESLYNQYLTILSQPAIVANDLSFESLLEQQSQHSLCTNDAATQMQKVILAYEQQKIKFAKREAELKDIIEAEFDRFSAKLTQVADDIRAAEIQRENLVAMQAMARKPVRLFNAWRNRIQADKKSVLNHLQRRITLRKKSTIAALKENLMRNKQAVNDQEKIKNNLKKIAISQQKTDLTFMFKMARDNFKKRFFTQLQRREEKTVVASIKKIMTFKLLNEPDEHGNYPLSMAMNRHMIEAAKLFLEHGANVNQESKMGADIVLTPLREAIQSMNVEGIKFLAENKADLNLISSDKKSPLLWIMEYISDPNIVKTLFTCGAKVDLITCVSSLQILKNRLSNKLIKPDTYAVISCLLVHKCVTDIVEGDLSNVDQETCQRCSSLIDLCKKYFEKDVFNALKKSVKKVSERIQSCKSSFKKGVVA